jgi:Tfp pilus assembly protein PilZ
MVNKRKHPRVTIKAISDVLCKDDNRRFKAYLGGISRGGLEVYSSEKMNEGCRLEILIHFIDKSGQPVSEKIPGKVRWSAPMEKDFIAGIEFDQTVDNKQNPALTNYIKAAEDYLGIG